MPPLGWRWSGPRLADRTRHVRRSLLVLAAWLLSPSYVLRLLCVLNLPCRASPWGRTTGDRHHPFIRLHHTGGAYSTRLKREAHFQGSAGVVCSTSHAGLLAPVASGSPEAGPSEGGPPETRPHSWGAVVSVECSSRTLPTCWQLCRKCTDPALHDACFRVGEHAVFPDSSGQPLANE